MRRNKTIEKLKLINYCPICESTYEKIILKSIYGYFSYSIKDDINSLEFRKMIDYNKDNIFFNCINGCNLSICLSNEKIYLSSKPKNYIISNNEIFMHPNIKGVNHVFNVNFDFNKISSKYIQDKLNNLLLL